MKKTTRALIAFIIFVYVAAVIVTAVFALNGKPYFYDVRVAANDTRTVTHRLDSFSSVTFCQYDGTYYGGEDNGITFRFEEKASLQKPEIVVPQAIDAFVKASVNNGVLELGTDFLPMLEDSTMRTHCWFRVDVRVPVTVYLPAGTLASLTVPEVCDNIRFNIVSLTAKSFAYNGLRDVTFSGCRIDTLCNSGGFPDSLDLNGSQRDYGTFSVMMEKNTEVKDMIVWRNPSKLVLKTDSVSSVGLLIREVGYDRNVDLSIANANVGQFRWIPGSYSSRLRLDITEPFDLSLNR